MLALDLGTEVLDEVVIEILTTKMGVTSGGLNLEDATKDMSDQGGGGVKKCEKLVGSTPRSCLLVKSKERNIEGTSSKIEDENVLLGSLVVKTEGDGSGGRLIDDTENLFR